MITCEFENSKGKITFSGRQSNWHLISMEGLGLTAKTFNAAAYPGTAGQKTLSIKAEARTITLKGDVKLTQELPAQFSIANALRILDGEGRLLLSNGTKTRVIAAHCTAFEHGEKHGCFQEFIVQFLCDNPYFTDTSSASAFIRHREGLLKKTFTFPTPFSIRYTRANIYNAGDVMCEPVIQILCVRAEGEEAGLRIVNHTTGQELSLDYRISENELLTFDIPNRRIYSGEGTSLLEYLSLTSYLSSFLLVPGKNDVEVEAANSSVLEASCLFSNQYVEAVL